MAYEICRSRNSHYLRVVGADILVRCQDGRRPVLVHPPPPRRPGFRVGEEAAFARSWEERADILLAGAHIGGCHCSEVARGSGWGDPPAEALFSSVEESGWDKGKWHWGVFP